MRYLIYKSGMNKCKIDYRTAFIEGGMASAGNKTLKWICNDSIKVQKYILIEIELSQKMIAEGWRYGQLKKIDLEELEYNNQKRLFMNEVKRFLDFSRSMEC